MNKIKFERRKFRHTKQRDMFHRPEPMADDELVFIKNGKVISRLRPKRFYLPPNDATLQFINKILKIELSGKQHKEMYYD